MGKYIAYIDKHGKELGELIGKTLEQHATTIEKIAGVMANSFRDGGKSIIFGNGGSYADALHFAAELEGAYRDRQRPPLAALVPANPAALTAIANDYGYGETFGRFVTAHAHRKDIVIGLSTSGNSPNVVNALISAHEIGAITVGFTGLSGGIIRKQCDILLDIPSTNTPRIQELHHFAYHEICEIIERELFERVSL